MTTQEATDTISTISDDIKDAIDEPSAPSIELPTTPDIDDSEILAIIDDEPSGGHLVRNLVLLVLAATVVGAVVAALRGRR